jgi:NAD(P)-dependent dehydrogenase (short-subunit alcohol dehydrogenase family)
MIGQDYMTHHNAETSFNTALVIGASGGLGAALARQLSTNADFQSKPSKYSQVLTLSRGATAWHSEILDYADESSIANSAAWVAEKCQTAPLRLIIVATGYLHTQGNGPERRFKHLDVAYLQRVMLVNAIGPALVIKHFAPLLPKTGVVRLAFISAKVGSIGDNALGGWYGYRASKAALNQIVKTASIELTRSNKQSVCIALHPGTVSTSLSEPFSKTGLNVRHPDVAATELLNVIQSLNPAQTGGFYDYKGLVLPW